MRVFVIQNVELASSRPLSVFVTGFLQALAPPPGMEINAIISRSEAIPAGIATRSGTIHQINASLYSVTGNLRFAWQAFRILRREHRRAPLDVLHCLYPNSSLLAAVCFKLVSRSGARIVYDTRSPWIEMIFARQHLPAILAKPVMALLFWQERLLIRAVNHFVFISEGIQRYYADKFGADTTRASVLPSAFELERFNPGPSRLREPLGLTDDHIVIGYVGTIDVSRELNVFVDYVGPLLARDDRVRMVFVGAGNAVEALQKQVRDSGWDHAIHFVGRIPHSEVAAAINGFDFGLCHLPQGTVYDHSFPLKTLEYLACGVPVLASDIEAHRYIAGELEGVFIYHDAEGVAAVISETPRQRISQDMSAFSWQSVASHYLAIYQHTA